MIRFVATLALAASVTQASLDATEIAEYITTQTTTYTNEWDRTQDCIFTDSGSAAHTAGSIVDDGAYGTVRMAFVHIPKSGWALKKYATVKSWVTAYNDDTRVWDKNKVVVVKDTAVPEIKYYDSTRKTCTWTDVDGGEHVLK